LAGEVKDKDVEDSTYFGGAGSADFHRTCIGTKYRACGMHAGYPQTLLRRIGDF
jgi:hypothetical protein